MSTPTAQRLQHALDVLSGLVTDGPAPAAGDAAFIGSLMAARQLDRASEPCPAGARHRAHALLAARGSGAWAATVRLVFDSWAALAPAARSLVAERLLRFQVPGVALEMEIGRDARDGALTVALAVEGALEVVRARVIVGSGARAHSVTLDAHGTGSLRLPARTNTIAVVLDDEDGEVLHTPPLCVGRSA